MRNILLIAGQIIIGIVFSSQLVFGLEPITDKKILSSFAKIIRTKQYICQSCRYVHPVAHKHDGSSYEVVCDYDLTYKVVLTPRSDMIVRPASSL